MPTTLKGRWVGAPAVTTGGGGGGGGSTELKAPVTGIGPRTAGNIAGRKADLGFVVADCRWADLQLNEGAEIDQSTTAANGWNQIAVARANNLPYRLRVHAGDEAPTWAKSIGGAPMTLIQTEQKPGQPPPGGETFTCGRWWTAAYLNAWGDLMSKLAALLDDDPLCREVAAHPRNTHYAEPFQSGTKNVAATAGPNTGKTNVQVMYEAMIASGVSAANAQVEKNGSGSVIGPSVVDKASILWPMDMVTVGAQRISRWQSFGWNKTRLYIPFNPFQQWEVTGTSPFTYAVRADPGGWTATAMSTMGANMGAQVVLGNNSLRVPLVAAGPQMPTMYKNLTDRTESPNSYQTATLDIIGIEYRKLVAGASDAQALAAVIRAGLGITTFANQSPTGQIQSPVTKLRGRSIELPPNWQNNLSAADAATWNDYAAGNSTGA